MYLTAKGSFQALQKGGVFFFNIGDIFDNEKIIVKSKMGGKRIPLGAYIILLFQKAGFELLDNVVWDKGEPQTNRHKNDGNNVPYYQRPANCYEHIFIFKKPGAKLKLNQNKKQLIDSNYQKFIPVYKIGPGGINRYGHTAPFPETVPLLSLQCFTNEGEIVLDPFLGSGTSVIVAEQCKRKGLGIELKEEYVKLSTKRAQDRGITIEIIDSVTGKSKTAKATQQLLKTF
jgi:DNA modification methylase